MKKITYTSADLQLQIAELEALALQQEEDLKSTAKELVQELKPANLLKGAISSTVKSPHFGQNLVKGALGLAVGFLTKKFFIRGSTNIVKKALGTAVELGVAKVVANKAGRLTATGLKMLSKLKK
ncbi:MAG TPA: hypothetical protein VL307_11065 [Chitinophagaceae bacterium]|nr:hypothetical protein [Chitinophagaceae bacterium]